MAKPLASDEERALYVIKSLDASELAESFAGATPGLEGSVPSTIELCSELIESPASVLTYT